MAHLKRHWYEPTVVPMPEGPLFDAGVEFDTSDPATSIPRLTISLTILRRQVRMHPLSMLVRAVAVVLVWFLLWSALPRPYAERGGVALDTFWNTVFASVVGGTAAKIVGLPGIPGILWAGILFNHIGPEVSYMTAGITPNIKKFANLFAVSIIVARAGLAINARRLKDTWKIVAAMAVGPLVFELVIHGLVAKAVFDELPSYTWSMLQGALASAIAPGVVIPGMLELIGGGKVGAVEAVLPAIVLDAVVGIWLINFVAALTFSSGSVAVEAVLGPVQFLIGGLGGLLVGYLFHQAVVALATERLLVPWHRPGKDGTWHAPPHAPMPLVTVLFTAVSVAIIFLGDIIEYSGGASVAVAVFAGTVSNLWSAEPVLRRVPQAHLDQEKAALQANNAWIWDTMAMPLLFACTGSSIDLTLLFDGGFFPGGIASVAAGMASRFLMAAGIVRVLGYGWLEGVFVGVAWLAKGAVQAALANVGVDRADAKDAEAAQVLANAAYLATIICAPLASIGVKLLGPVCLPTAAELEAKAAEAKQAETKEGEVQKEPESKAADEDDEY